MLRFGKGRENTAKDHEPVVIEIACVNTIRNSDGVKVELLMPGWLVNERYDAGSVFRQDDQPYELIFQHNTGEFRFYDLGHAVPIHAVILRELEVEVPPLHQGIALDDLGK